MNIIKSEGFGSKQHYCYRKKLFPALHEDPPPSPHMISGQIGPTFWVPVKTGQIQRTTRVSAFVEIRQNKISQYNFIRKYSMNFKISLSCVRLNNQLGYNFTTENWDHQKWEFCQIPKSQNWKKKKHAFMCDMVLWKTYFGLFIQSYMHQECLNIYVTHTYF